MTAISERSLKRIALVGRRQRGQSGFTLVELMIVVLVLGVLAGIAYASYDNATLASRRKAGATCLLEAAQFMERFYTTNLTYVGAALPASACRTELAGNYDIDIAAQTATTYSLTATPDGRQAAKDNAKCGTLGINQAGTKTRSGSLALAECW